MHLRQTVSKIVLTEYDNILHFFGEKLFVPDNGCKKNWIEEVFDALFEWWFIPRNEPYIQQVEDAKQAAVEEYMNTGELPDFILQAKRFAETSQYAFSDTNKHRP